MNMQGKRRSVAQRARDRKRTAELYLKGWLQVDIAEEVGIAQPTVSRDLKALHKTWLDDALMDFNEAKSKEIAKIDNLELEYWQAWARSRESAETVRQEGQRNTEGVLGAPDKVVKTAKDQIGDPRFLSGVQWCIEKRCKIFGFDAPQEIKHSGDVAISYSGNIDPSEL